MAEVAQFLRANRRMLFMGGPQGSAGHQAACQRPPAGDGLLRERGLVAERATDREVLAGLWSCSRRACDVRDHPSLSYASL
jgi:hypothetical protein